MGGRIYMWACMCVGVYMCVGVHMCGCIYVCAWGEGIPKEQIACT